MRSPFYAVRQNASRTILALLLRKHEGLSMKPILITCGDPAGVGPEVALKALLAGAAGDHPVVLVGNLNVWQRAAEMVGTDVYSIPELDNPRQETGWPVVAAADCRLEAMADPTDPTDAQLAERGGVQLNAINKSVQACLAGLGAAVVTMPIDKRANQAAGALFPGHTELIAKMCRVPRPVMMLFGPEIRVVPITTHIAYADVPGRLSPGLVLATIRTVAEGVRDLFSLQQPRLALCGLNPHAGEGGLFGAEEIRILSPAVELARQEGIEIDGPLPADTVFVFRDRYDAIICPTHDQALIPLKLLHFDCGVNTTLGLPIVRTSPDHGTARDIAWKNKANPCSAEHAIAAAVRFSATRLASEEN
jgi:4-hydroxythreonine-4-phosphate dehydrogenase